MTTIGSDTSSLFASSALQQLNLQGLKAKKMTPEQTAQFNALLQTPMPSVQKNVGTITDQSVADAAAKTKFNTQAIAQGAEPAGVDVAKTEDATTKFMDFMDSAHKGGIGAFVRAQYLASKGLTEDSFSQLSQDEQNKINEEIKQQIEEAMRKEIEKDAAKAAT